MIINELCWDESHFFHKHGDNFNYVFSPITQSCIAHKVISFVFSMARVDFIESCEFNQKYQT
jgi:hypothetical protein